MILNAAGALIVGDRARDFSEGVAIARQLIEEGDAAAKLDQLVEASNGIKDR